MSDYNEHFNCPECNGYGGNHYSECSSYEGNGSVGFGGSGLAKFVFGIFVVVGLFLMVACPPLGAGVIALGAYLTGV